MSDLNQETAEKPESEWLDPTEHVVYRASPRAREWVKNLADHCSLNLTNLHWQALLRMAEATGFHEKVPPRYPRVRSRRKH